MGWRRLLLRGLHTPPRPRPHLKGTHRTFVTVQHLPYGSVSLQDGSESALQPGGDSLYVPQHVTPAPATQGGRPHTATRLSGGGGGGLRLAGSMVYV